MDNALDGTPGSCPPVIPQGQPSHGPWAGGTVGSGRKRWWVWLLVVGACVFGGLMLIGCFWLVSLVSAERSFGRVGSPVRLGEMVLEPGPASAKIAVIRIEGIISRSVARGGVDMVDIIEAQFKAAERDGAVRGVVLAINSPGGEVVAADTICNIVRGFQARTHKPVVAAMDSLAASGGYYVAAPCRWIVAHKLTITGSIGVILSTWNYRGLMDKVGLRPMIYKRGRYKDMLSGARDPDAVPPEEERMIYALLDEVYEQFKAVVREGRARTLTPEWEAYADGRVLSGQQAFELGFVDELGDFKTAVRRAKELAGVSKARLVEYRAKFDLVDLLGLSTDAETRAVRVDLGLNVPRLEPGKLYFLPPAYFP